MFSIFFAKCKFPISLVECKNQTKITSNKKKGFLTVSIREKKEFGVKKLKFWGETAIFSEKRM